MKKIVWNVILFHVGLVCWMALWVPSKEELKKPIKIRSITQTKMVPLPANSVQTVVAEKSQPHQEVRSEKMAHKESVAKAVSAKAAKKVTKTTTKGSSTKQQVPQYLVDQLQESIAKIEQNRHKEIPQGKLSVPVCSFKIDSGEVQGGNEFTATLIKCFQKELQLPEEGEVKIALTLRQDGSLIECKLLSKESQYNAQFLEQALHAMRFPSFTGELAKQKEHTFVITFCNY